MWESVIILCNNYNIWVQDTHMESYRGSPRVQATSRKFWKHSYSSFNGVQNTVEPWLPQWWWLWPKLLLLLCTTWKRWHVWEIHWQSTNPLFWITINMHCLLYTCNYYATKFNTEYIKFLLDKYLRYTVHTTLFIIKNNCYTDSPLRRALSTSIIILMQFLIYIVPLHL